MRSWSVFADILFPNRRIFADIFGQHLHTFDRIQIDDYDAIFTKPVHAAAKIDGFAEDDGANAELPNEAAAVPARGQRGSHDFVAVGALAARAAESIGLGVN